MWNFNCVLIIQLILKVMEYFVYVSYSVFLALNR